MTVTMLLARADEQVYVRADDLITFLHHTAATSDDPTVNEMLGRIADAISFAALMHAEKARGWNPNGTAYA